MAKRKRRNFTPEFKGQVVLEALSGESSQAEVCRRHNLSEDQLSKWKQQVVENVGSLFVSTEKLKCIRLFRPQFHKVKIRFAAEIL